MLHPVFRTSGHSKSLEFSFDPATGDRVVTRGKLIKDYLHVGPCKMRFDAEKQSTPHASPLFTPSSLTLIARATNNKLFLFFLMGGRSRSTARSISCLAHSSSTVL